MKTPHSPVAGPSPNLLCLLQEGSGVTLNPEAVISIHSDAALEYRVWDTKHYTFYMIRTPKSPNLWYKQ